MPFVSDQFLKRTIDRSFKIHAQLKVSCQLKLTLHPTNDVCVPCKDWNLPWTFPNSCKQLSAVM